MDKELKKAAEEYGKSNPIIHFTADGTEKDVATPMFDFMTGANWQKQQIKIKAEALFYYHLNVIGDVSFCDIEGFIDEFNKTMED